MRNTVSTAYTAAPTVVTIATSHVHRNLPSRWTGILKLRKIVRNPGQFPNGQAATITKDWCMPPRTWREASTQFAMIFGERFTN